MSSLLAKPREVERARMRRAIRFMFVDILPSFAVFPRQELGMRVLSSLAIGLLCLMCGLALNVGLEVNHDQCGLLGLSTGTSFIDAIAPTGYATLSIGLVAGYAWWADQAERSFAVEFVVAVVAFLFVMFFFFLTTTLASHFHLDEYGSRASLDEALGKLRVCLRDGGGVSKGLGGA